MHRSRGALLGHVSILSWNFAAWNLDKVLILQNKDIGKRVNGYRFEVGE